MTFELLITVSGIFVLAGCVKGIVGFGLPTIAVGLGALVFDIPTAMMLIVAPTLFTNFIQIMKNGSLINVLKKSWPFMLGSILLVPLGILCLSNYPDFSFERLLGMSIVVYSLASLSGFSWVIGQKRLGIVGIVSGLANSLVTGMTGSFSVPGVMYLRALRLSAEDLLCAMGVLFLLSTLAMSGSLVFFDYATPELTFLSVLMCIPVAFGVLLGTRLRAFLSEAEFTKVFLRAFLMLGLYLLIFGG